MDEHTDEHASQDDGPEPDGRVFRTWLGDELIEIPATIAGIREALPAEQRDEFTKVIEDTPARDMPLIMNRWSRRTRPEIDAATRREMDRIEGLALDAEADLIMGEDLNVVQDRFQSRVRKGGT
ncbi:hypothetical protein B4N89_04840 [Embleya scabrispora]|uniref:Uncharacterized protein n=1 Tax=Embleya scabrispora TaxID=159449 RepID=A0A1T3NUA0_9ACTN|nr:hypothetical protein [Embleya scabrispora]OPC80364.1 hypothetical protein B4N89_04840 [Embleya scabrispora]